ncbi:MAG: succinate dehydrogenase [Parachlamydiales bacterium]
MGTFPKNFASRRWHSFLGLALVVYIIEHLLTNSQAALWIGDDGEGFINMVNAIHRLPYLQVLEILLIALPFLFHGYLGVKYLRTSRVNSLPSDGRTPSLKYVRNRKFTWHRIASLILVVGVILHVIQMRFMDYPSEAREGDKVHYFVRVSLDSGLYTVADRLGLQIVDGQQVEVAQKALQEKLGELGMPLSKALSDLREEADAAGGYSPELAAKLDSLQQLQNEQTLVKALKKKALRGDQVLIGSGEFGKAALMTVRNTFKSPWMMGLYTVFVLAAVFHGFNGLWTFGIVWGITLTARSQKMWARGVFGLIVLFSFLGLASVWLTYWVNLRN